MDPGLGTKSSLQVFASHPWRTDSFFCVFRAPEALASTLAPCQHGTLAEDPLASLHWFPVAFGTEPTLLSLALKALRCGPWQSLWSSCLTLSLSWIPKPSQAAISLPLFIWYILNLLLKCFPLPLPSRGFHRVIIQLSLQVWPPGSLLTLQRQLSSYSLGPLLYLISPSAIQLVTLSGTGCQETEITSPEEPSHQTNLLHTLLEAGRPTLIPGLFKGRDHLIWVGTPKAKGGMSS